MKKDEQFFAELRWLRECSSKYAGEWVALVGDQVIAHSRDSQEVFAAAQAAKQDHPFVTRIAPFDETENS